MKYMGSKAKHAKEIIKIIDKYRTFDQTFIDVFCGGCNFIEHIEAAVRIANDKHSYLIAMWKELQKGWLPKNYYSEEEYLKAREDYKNRTNKFFQNYEIGFIGFGITYGGRFFEGYARSKDDKGVERNHTLESKKNILKQLPKLKSVIFKNYDYLEIPESNNYIYYCDAPYKGTKEYKISLLGKFDFDKYYDWLRKRAENNLVFISEYNMPDDFISLWEKKVTNSLTLNTGAKCGVERLYIHEKCLISKKNKI